MAKGTIFIDGGKASQREAMCQFVESLGIDPGTVSPQVTLVHGGGEAWDLHLTELIRDEHGVRCYPDGSPMTRPLVLPVTREQAEQFRACLAH